MTTCLGVFLAACVAASGSVPLAQQREDDDRWADGQQRFRERAGGRKGEGKGEGRERKGKREGGKKRKGRCARVQEIRSLSLSQARAGIPASTHPR